MFGGEDSFNKDQEEGYTSLDKSERSIADKYFSLFLKLFVIILFVRIYIYHSFIYIYIYNLQEV